MKLTNKWNRLVYRLWSPFYDRLFDRFFASPGRKRAMEVLNLQPGERVLLVGVGTGADLPLLPEGIEAVGIDLSPAMLGRARSRLPLPGRIAMLVQSDALNLPIKTAAFDAIILNLVLSVVPDGSICLQEALRALKPGGRAVIYDKFLPDSGKLTLIRQLLNQLTTLIGTDITRRFSDLAAGIEYHLICDEPSLLHGTYRVMLISK